MNKIIDALMETICFVYTENRHNQILIFKNYNDAHKWCKAATRWTEEEIKKNIRYAQDSTGDYYNLFPCFE